MQRITFDQLPELVAEMNERLERIEQILSKSDVPRELRRDSFLNVHQAAELLHLSVSTVYQKVHFRQIPYCKREKRLYFSRVELEEWIKAGRTKTSDEIEAEAASYFLNKRRIRKS